MNKELLEKLLLTTLTPYLLMSDEVADIHLKNVNLSINDRVGDSMDGLQVIIFDNLLPRHFHVKNKDGSLNAKFTIDGCKYLSGEISDADLKKIELFAKSNKGEIILHTILSPYIG
ncbi:DUF4160 domain-containing protein [Mucilaginibacter sp. UYCu711]|uniref:DUF4160 domain-containing protein n=1 Tax=Mucilaginibacter sp. UYCu711 TaxID=3156339 RepID=UPI003D227155